MNTSTTQNEKQARSACQKDFYKINQSEIGRIQPNGWLRTFLERQMQGLTGHLDEIAYPFNTVVWGNQNQTTMDGYSSNADDAFNNINWWGYEQVGYWLDGYEKTAALLDLPDSVNKAQKQLRDVLQNPDNDGYLGPLFLKSGENRIRWPHVILFRALITLYEETHDDSIIEKLEKHYLSDTFAYDEFRDVTNVEIMLWVYSKTQNARLLEKAERDYNSYSEKAAQDNSRHERVDFGQEKPYNHGVTYNEISKLGAILYAYTGNTAYLQHAISAYEKIDKYFMLPSGCHCSNEFLISNDYFHCSEMCDVSDFTWSLGYLLMATANGEYADKIEKCIFNAGIGAALEDFSAIQYFSCCNQVLATENSCHNFFHKGGDWMQYLAKSEVQCCLGNSNRFMPNYVSRMFMQKGNRIFACLYGESVFKTEIDGKQATFEEKTLYPFDDCIEISYSSTDGEKALLALRIPAWCKNYTISVNGATAVYDVEKGFAYLRTPLSHGDTVRLHLESAIKKVAYKNSGVYFEKGALVFALGGKGARESAWKENQNFPSCVMRADFKWNYAVVQNSAPSFTNRPSDGYVWDAETCPYQINVPAREVLGWKTVKTCGKKIKSVWNLYDKKYTYIRGDFEFTPTLPTPKYVAENVAPDLETLTLIPYGCAKMRMTVLPIVK